jgi:hypothetical protein
MSRTVYQDLDESLVCTKPLEPGRALPSGWNEIMFGDRRYATIVRPSASPFLRALKDSGYSICLLTTGKSEFQRRVLELHDLLRYFDGVYDLESSFEVSTPWVLVDDLEGRCNGIVQKMNLLGICDWGLTEEQWSAAVARHLITCPRFVGRGEVQTLLPVLDEIDRKIYLQQ